MPKQSESESKMSSPCGGGVYPSAFAQGPGGHMGLTAGRALPIMATESGIVNRDKTQNKDHEFRALGESTVTAQKFHAGLVYFLLSKIVTDFMFDSEFLGL